MKIRRKKYVGISICIAIVVTIVFSCSETVGSVNSQNTNIPISRGPLGWGIYYWIYSPDILKVGINTTVTFEFQAQNAILVDYINIKTGSDHKLIANDTLMQSGQKISYNATVNPSNEGPYGLRVSVAYNYQDHPFYNNDYIEDHNDVILQARQMTYDELIQLNQTLSWFSAALIIILVITVMILLILSHKKSKSPTN